uniref:Thioredoxin domain-containing protein n=1 Tax=Globodera rostochiensis TaxID=31243 RepID=A0A914GX99_GLORO
MVFFLYKHEAVGHDELRACFADLKRSNRIFDGGVFILFNGWSHQVHPFFQYYKRDAERTTKKALDHLKNIDKNQQQNRNFAFITCNVGDWEAWLEPTSSLRMDATLGVKIAPTLIEYSLEDGHCVEGQKLDSDEHFQTANDIVEFMLKRPLSNQEMMPN